MKCKLCEKDISWKHHLPPLPYLVGFDSTLQERFCPDCWNRIWAEWYYSTGDESWDYDLSYDTPTDEYIISKYKGNDLIGTIEKDIIVEEPKKKHWWNK